MRPETKNGNGSPQIDRVLELELVDAALLGDMEAFAKLFEHYRVPLLGLCLKRMGDPSLAEDIVQEVFIRAFISLPNSDHRKPIWPWLATIATRMCIDLKRRRSFTQYSGDIEAVDADANGGALDDQTASALDVVIASERRAELFQSLRVLPKRYRRVFLLYALDGWSCAEIAEAEGISVHAVHHLLFRARRKMQAARQNGPLALMPLIWLRTRLQEAEERIRVLLGLLGDRLSVTGTIAVSLGVLAAIAATVGSPVEQVEEGNAIGSGRPAISTTQALSSQAAFSNSDVSSPPKAPDASQRSVAELAGSLAEDVVNPSQNATPENSFIESIQSSPSYQSDHTILATGAYSPVLTTGSNSPLRVLFISNDGGASWKVLPSRFLLGSTVALPPGYPNDRRLFVLGDLGLQQSDDGGASFRTVSPVRGSSLAISPLFGRGASKIFITGKVLFEYDAESGVTRPGLLPIPPSSGRAYRSMALSPGYPSDPTILVSDDGDDFYRCEGPVCERRVVVFGSPTLRLSPRFDRDGLAYAFTAGKLFVTNDGVRTFQEVHFDEGGIKDLAVLWSASSDPFLFATTTRLPGSLSRSLDAGRSWSSSSIGFAGFRYGADRLIVTPTGRLFATGRPYGIACSEDGGLSWDPRCPPEL